MRLKRKKCTNLELVQCTNRSSFYRRTCTRVSWPTLLGSSKIIISTIRIKRMQFPLGTLLLRHWTIVLLMPHPWVVLAAACTFSPGICSFPVPRIENPHLFHRRGRLHFTINHAPKQRPITFWRCQFAFAFNSQPLIRANSLHFLSLFQKIALPWTPATEAGLHQETDTNNNSVVVGVGGESNTNNNNSSSSSTPAALGGTQHIPDSDGSRPTSSGGNTMPVGSVQGQNPTQGLVHWMSAVMAEHMTSSNTHHDPTVGMHYMWNGGVDVSEMFFVVHSLPLMAPNSDSI